MITGELASATGLPDLPAGGKPDAPFVLAALFGEPPGTTRWESLRQLRSWWRSNDETVLVYRRQSANGRQYNTVPSGLSAHSMIP